MNARSIRGLWVVGLSILSVACGSSGGEKTARDEAAFSLRDCQRNGNSRHCEGDTLLVCEDGRLTASYCSSGPTGLVCRRCILGPAAPRPIFIKIIRSFSISTVAITRAK